MTGRMNVVVRQKTQHSRHLDAHNFFVFFVHPAGQRQRRVGSRLVKPFKCGEFFRLVFRHACALVWPLTSCSSEAISATVNPTLSDARANSRCFFFNKYQALTLTMRNAPACHAPHNVWNKRSIEDGLNTNCQKSVISARAFTPFAHYEVIAGGRLHPGVGDDDPDGAEMRAEADHAGREEMHFAAYPVPAEQQHGEKTGFEEKRKDAFRRQRAAEHVADKPRIGRPVRAEFKFHDDARGHADGEREREDLGPEPRHLVIKRVFGLEPQPFHDDEQDAQPDAQRRVNVVKRNRRSELDAG